MKKWLTFFSVASCVALLATQSVFAFDLVRDGQPACTIILPDDATQVEKDGAERLVTYLEKATKAKLQITTESKAPAGATVAIGRTRAAKAAGITAEDLQVDGYHIIVNGSTLFLVGRDGYLESDGRRIGAQGSIRASLALLEKLGFRWLQPTPMGLYIPPGNTFSVPADLNITHTPPLMYLAGRLYYWGDWSLANSCRKGVAVYSAGGHTWDLAVPPSFWKEHPEYFRMQNGQRIEPNSINLQLCPTNPNVVKLITQYTLDQMAKGYDLVALGQPDAFVPCECPQCSKFSAAEQIHNLQRSVAEACYKAYPDRKVHLLVYGPSEELPAGMKPYPPNTAAEVALTGGLELRYGSHEKGLDFWRTIAPAGITTYVYWMGEYHSVGVGPKFTPRQASEKMKMLLAHGVRGIYLCGAGENWGMEGPTVYVLARLASDPTQNWSNILDEYCQLTFGPAGRTMRQYYDLINERVEKFPDPSLLSAELFPGMFPPVVTERLESLLSLARKQADGDAKILGWIDNATISLRYAKAISQGYIFYDAYNINPTRQSLEQLAQSVNGFNQLVDEIWARGKSDPQFFKNYWPNGGYWTNNPTSWSIRNNANKIFSPFNWNFEKLLASGVLPGKTRASVVVTRLDQKPELTGKISDSAWAHVPWVTINEVALGATEASTRMKIAYDKDNLYLAYECAEPRMDEMKVLDYPRDGKVFNTECVEAFFAPDGFGQKRMQMVMSPATGVWDGRYGYIEDPLHPLNLAGLADTSWNPNFTRAYDFDKANKRWTLEVAIPFKELGTTSPVQGEHWRGNFGRERHMGVWDYKKYGNAAEYFLWSPDLQNASFIDPSVFGDIYFGNGPQ